VKVCPHCGESYREYVDFCFGDGEILAGLALLPREPAELVPLEDLLAAMVTPRAAEAGGSRFHPVERQGGVPAAIPAAPFRDRTRDIWLWAIGLAVVLSLSALIGGIVLVYQVSTWSSESSVLPSPVRRTLYKFVFS
jgi:hypothetical protein